MNQCLEKQAVMAIAHYNLAVKGLYSKGGVCAYMKQSYLHCNQTYYLLRYLKVSLSRLMNSIVTFSCAAYR